MARPPESVRSLGPKRLLEGGFSSEDQMLFRVVGVCVWVFVFVCVVGVWKLLLMLDHLVAGDSPKVQRTGPA